MDDEETSRRCLRAYFDAHGAVRHQIESFDHFADSVLQRIIQESSDVSTEHDGKVHRFRFGKVTIPRPTTRESSGFVRTVQGPAEAMARNLTYASAVLVDVNYTITDAASGALLQDDTYREVVLCKLPIMVRSRYCYLSGRAADMSCCAFDAGGYFVINGLEKTLIAQLLLRTNEAFVWAGKTGRRLYTCEVRSCHEQKLRSTSTLLVHLQSSETHGLPRLVAALPFLESTLTLPTLFRILGVDSVDAMVGCVTDAPGTLRDLLRGILVQDADERPLAEILRALGREATTEATPERQQRYLHHIVCNELLPHMGIGSDTAHNRGKQLYLGYMVRKLLQVYLGDRPVDDRDHFKNRRVYAPGHLMSLLFRQLFRTYLKSLQSQLHKAVTAPHRQLNVVRIVNARKITAGFKYAFATGNWGVQARQSTAQSGVAQVLNRNSMFAGIADKRRLSCPANRDSKNAEIRQLHSSAWGVVCPCESPEGASCGLIMSFASLCHVRINACAQRHFVSLCADLAELLVPRDAATPADVDSVALFHNGVLHGYVRPGCVERVLAFFRRARADHRLPFDGSVCLRADDNSIAVGTDAGCLCRPVFVAERRDELTRIAAAEQGSRLWQRLVDAGCVMYVDKDEEQGMCIATRLCEARRAPERFSHAEIHPASILGMSGSMIPFSHHNQAPRNTYQCAMGKQSIGVYTSNWTTRFDTVSYGLWYPQRPLVGTWADEVLGTSHTPSGTNAIVAVLTHGGFNQEDSLIFNQGSLERGMVRCVVMRTVRDELGAADQEFCNPSTECSGRLSGSYDKLGDDGTVPVGTVVRAGDVVVGKIRRADPKQQTTSQDLSSAAKCAGTGVVDRVMVATNKDGLGLRKVRIRETRQPNIGDKFTSRHGQKGVIGAVYPEADMPFTSDGRKPDIILNPHALPSRMTIGQLMEMAMAALCCETGRIGDGTAFCQHGYREIAAALRARGLRPDGCERLHCGLTGARIEADVFMAPVYMQSLKHMVADKVHARARGPVDAKTRQPTEGRRLAGGLRFGEMERDCLVGHGSTALIRERMFTQADPYCVYVCRRCGLLAEGPTQEPGHLRSRQAMCRNCDAANTVVPLPMPYATKLFIQEVLALNIAMRLRLQPSREPV
jgi:DNA-directed RNA polymerase II subunit RPB2